MLSRGTSASQVPMSCGMSPAHSANLNHKVKVPMGTQTSPRGWGRPVHNWTFMPMGSYYLLI